MPEQPAHRPSISLLGPPETVVSPPSPIEPSSSYFQHAPAPTSPTEVQYDSPESDDDDDGNAGPSHVSSPSARPPAPRRPSDQLGSYAFGLGLGPVVASPCETLLHPVSPPLSAPSTLPSASASRAGSPALSRLPSSVCPRSPSPSSPHYRPKGAGHRRESSHHVVRETTYGAQSRTEDGERMVNQYKIGRSLGKGAYAKVELAVDVSTGKEYAIKEFSKSRLHHQSLAEKQQAMQRQRARRSRPAPRGSPSQPGEDGKRKAGAGEGAAGLDPPVVVDDQAVRDDPLALIRREIAVMKKLDHPNIICLYEAISVPNADALFLVLEYLPGGTLMHVEPGCTAARGPPFDRERAREYFRQLCLGLEYLHENGVVHRDIKPDNVLLSADRELVKLCDFGVSEMFVAAGDDRIKKSGGSPAFLSPESFTAVTSDVHGRAVDIWALGVTLYCMLVGTLPFNVHDPIDLFRLVRETDPVLPDDWDDNMRDLMRRMLDKNPRTRIIIADIREHAWVTADGAEPMITTDDNLYDVGKKVDEPTQEELGNAINTLRGVFTVVRAVQKMRRLQLHRRSVSAQSNQSASDASTPPPLPSPPAQPAPAAPAAHASLGGLLDAFTMAARSADSHLSATSASAASYPSASTPRSTPPAPRSGAASPTACDSPRTAGSSSDLRIDQCSTTPSAKESAVDTGLVASPAETIAELVDLPVEHEVELVDSPVDAM
ncbi:hypothetical protein Q5752_005800 [Cryptotrichosporon argae]